MSAKEIKDAPIPNATKSADQIKEQLRKSNDVVQFSKLGTELLEQTERPTIITLTEFAPFISLFNMDKERYTKERFNRGETYTNQMNHLFEQWRQLVNLYQPVVIIRSKEDPKEECVLPRMFTRIRSDTVEGKSARTTVPAAVARNASTTRDMMIQNASLHDIAEANKTPEQLSYFRNIRVETALIEKAFVERNMSPEKRAIAMGEVAAPDNIGSPSLPMSGSASNTVFDDDDD